MSHLQNMVQVGLVAAGARLGKTHVTDTSRHFHQMFAGYFGVGLPANPMIGEKAIDNGGIDILTTDQVNAGFAEDADISSRVEAGHRGRS